jgi:hypothetical protein
MGKLEQPAPPDRSGSLQHKKTVEFLDAIAGAVISSAL